MKGESLVNCPICRNEVEPGVLCKATLGGDSEYKLLECAACGVRYLHPPPTAERLAKFYSSQYYGTDWYKQQGWGMAFAKSALRGLTPGRFLDVGCGLGYFIDGVRRHSEWEVCGVEFSPEAVEYARRELGLEAHQGELSEVSFPEHSFDYVQVRNVLEHVTDPVRLMRECRRILKPGGTLHLFVPNGRVDSLDLVKFYREEGRAGLSKSGHLFFFPRRALERLFDDVGFELVRARTYGIRRGLASLGRWPRSGKWKRPYVPRADSDAGEGEGKIVLPPRKNRPDLYYRYRQLRMNLRMLPGMREFGLDFELLLRPK